MKKKVAIKQTSLITIHRFKGNNYKRSECHNITIYKFLIQNNRHGYPLHLIGYYSKKEKQKNKNWNKNIVKRGEMGLRWTKLFQIFNIQIGLVSRMMDQLPARWNDALIVDSIHSPADYENIDQIRWNQSIWSDQIGSPLRLCCWQFWGGKYNDHQDDLKYPSSIILHRFHFSLMVNKLSDRGNQHRLHTTPISSFTKAIFVFNLLYWH